MSADEKQADKPAEEKPKKSKKKMIFMVLGLVGLVASAGVPLLMLTGKEPPPAEEHPAEEEPKEEPKRVEIADLGQFIVNLSENSAFIKVRIMIEYDAALIERQLNPHGGEEGGEAHGGGASGGGGDKAAGGPHPHIMKNENKFRDVIIRILSSKKTAELLTVEGKTRLKEELVDGLNEVVGLEEPPIVGVLFTEFIIQ
jgi:flagellar basal body-associated protein FliL